MDGQKDRPTIVDVRNVAAPRVVHVSAKRQAPLREVGERSDQPERDGGIQPAGGLVQDEHARFGEQLDGDRDAFAFAAGDAAPGKGERAADGRVARAIQAERLDDGVCRLGFRARRGARAREGGESENRFSEGRAFESSFSRSALGVRRSAASSSSGRRSAAAYRTVSATVRDGNKQSSCVTNPTRRESDLSEPNADRLSADFDASSRGEREAPPRSRRPPRSRTRPAAYSTGRRWRSPGWSSRSPTDRESPSSRREQLRTGHAQDANHGVGFLSPFLFPRVSPLPRNPRRPSPETPTRARHAPCPRLFRRRAGACAGGGRLPTAHGRLSEHRARGAAETPNGVLVWSLLRTRVEPTERGRRPPPPGGGRTRALASQREEAPSPGRGFAKRRRVETQRARAVSTRAPVVGASRAAAIHVVRSIFESTLRRRQERSRSAFSHVAPPAHVAAPASWASERSSAMVRDRVEGEWSARRERADSAREGRRVWEQAKATPHVFVVNFAPRPSALLIFRGDW